MHALRALESQLSEALQAVNRQAGYPGSLVCTQQGLLLAEAGARADGEIAAGLVSLFDDIVQRARRDLAMPSVDELTLAAGEGGDRYVIRPLSFEDPQLYLVVRVPARKPWRQSTNTLLRRLEALLAPFLEAVHAADASAP